MRTVRAPQTPLHNLTQFTNPKGEHTAMETTMTDTVERSLLLQDAGFENLLRATANMKNGLGKIDISGPSATKEQLEEIR